MSSVNWLPLTADHPYNAMVDDIREQPSDGFSLERELIAEHKTDRTVTGLPRRTYWLQVFARGKNDRKAVLTVWGVPIPPEVNESHIADATEALGWAKYRWERGHLGRAVIFKESD